MGDGKRWSFTTWLLRARYVVSHAWKFWKRITGEHDIVFFDYMSLPQNGLHGERRSEDEEKLFKKALKNMNLLYTYRLCRVLVIPDVPQRDDVVRYETRGWCFTELAMSTAHDRVVNNDRSSIVAEMINTLGMPVLPEKFREDFKDKTFTKSGDKETTVEIYAALFRHISTDITWPARVIYMAYMAFLSFYPYTYLVGRCWSPF